MIKTKLLEPESFISVLKPTGKVYVTERDKEIKMAKCGIFGGTRKETIIVKHECQELGLDEELLNTFPIDVQEQIRKNGVDDPKGYLYYSNFGWGSGGISSSNEKYFDRSFDNTVNDFTKKNKITKKNLISMEYCKKECDNTCTITGAYISWDDGK